MKNVGQGHLPKHLYYFRDGVFEGQYAQLMRQEVADIRNVLFDLGQCHPPDLTYLVRQTRSRLEDLNQRISGVPSDE